MPRIGARSVWLSAKAVAGNAFADSQGGEGGWGGGGSRPNGEGCFLDVLALHVAGVALVVLALLLHLGDLSSLGVSYLWPIGTGEMPHMETQLVREKMRPREVSPENVRNQR